MSITTTQRTIASKFQQIPSLFCLSFRTETFAFYSYRKLRVFYITSTVQQLRLSRVLCVFSFTLPIRECTNEHKQQCREYCRYNDAKIFADSALFRVKLPLTTMCCAGPTLGVKN